MASTDKNSNIKKIKIRGEREAGDETKNEAEREREFREELEIIEARHQKNARMDEELLAKWAEMNEKERKSRQQTEKLRGGLDNRLLNQEQEDEAARQLKERKRGESGEEAGEEADADDQPRSLRQRVRAARQALDLKEQAKKKLEEKVTAPAKAGTSRALQWAWKVLIPSWGLSLIYINIHVFLKYVFGEKLFCKLGEEWLPKQAADAAGEVGQTVNKSAGLVEIMVLLILDLIVLSVILGFLALIVMIVDFMQASWYEKVIIFIGGLTKLGWAGIKALMQLF